VGWLGMGMLWLGIRLRISLLVLAFVLV
jgi:hypothetical protein